MRLAVGLFCLMLASGAASAAELAAPGTMPRPLVIAHRGASGYVPEHTLAAYTRAIEQGADYIEVDLVSTKEGYLVARHENELSTTTDVAQRFPCRKTTKTIDGESVTGWFSEDLTLDEIGELRAKERVPFRDQNQNGRYAIPSIAEVLSLRASKSRELGRQIGIYIEVKHPSYFRGIGRPIEESLISILAAWAMDRPGSPIFLQSFDAGSVAMMAQGTQVPTIHLLDKLGPDTTDEALKKIATYAKGIGPAKTMIMPVDANGRALPATDLVKRAHAAGLLVHPYTFRPEGAFLPVNYNGDALREYCDFKRLGVDGVFTDTPDLALKAFTESCPMSK